MRSRAQGYQVFGLSAHRQVETLLRQIEEFHPKVVCMTDPEAAAQLDRALAGRANAPRLLTGRRVCGSWLHWTDRMWF